MTLVLPTKPALLLIDVQQAFEDASFGQSYPANVDRHIEELLVAWRGRQLPVVIVRHDSTEPNSLLRPERPGNALKAFVEPRQGEWLISKNVNSAFIGTDLESKLRSAGIDTLVIAGYTSQHCVNTTVRMAANLGFHVILVEDACVAFELTYHGERIDALQVQRLSMASLAGEFAQIVDTERLLAANPIS